jgi:hypothetical protein
VFLKKLSVIATFDPSALKELFYWKNPVLYPILKQSRDIYTKPNVPFQIILIHIVYSLNQLPFYVSAGVPKGGNELIGVMHLSGM